MKGSKYKRTVEELQSRASMFWPSELSEREAELSVIPKLIETQDQFISIISTSFPDLGSLFKAVDLAKLTANLFVKHLVVLADFGGEQLMRLNSAFNELFPSGKFKYICGDSVQTYSFKALPVSGPLNNDKLGISGKKLLEKRPFDDLLKDVSIILIYGSACESEQLADVLSKCEIGAYLGQPDQLSKFIKQRYIWVSRITGGAQANTLGQLAQDFVKEYLEKHLTIPGVEVTRNGELPGIVDRKAGTPAKFDIVVSKDGKYVGVEVSFQVTTNSTIERKANSAKARFKQVSRAGYKNAYVIDGAGNLMQRVSATRTLCNYSHCTVAFSESELRVLCDFIGEYFEGSDC
ncbi:MAG: restriction endonuclease [Dehalococcoidia bacterium]|nr:restriction endonuclease [Dehalococcoidia bacterium]